MQQTRTLLVSCRIYLCWMYQDSRFKTRAPNTVLGAPGLSPPAENRLRRALSRSSSQSQVSAPEKALRMTQARCEPRYNARTRRWPAGDQGSCSDTRGCLSEGRWHQRHSFCEYSFSDILSVPFSVPFSCPSPARLPTSYMSLFVKAVMSSRRGSSG